ncbi:MAG: MerR family transcriptional regulator [Thermodesulfobacteriota bacterium]|nr:MerR family transcriptional regulator [Thermodesulfobacteriota bacterium]
MPDNQKNPEPLLFEEPETTPDIPDKLYFRIGEVCKIAGVADHVLRFWETQFPQLKPGRTDAGQRLYSKSDIERILKIKHLLYEKKFTMKGAKRYLSAAKPPADTAGLIKEIQRELSALRDILS